MRTFLICLVVLVVVLAGGLVAADGPLRVEVQRRVADALRTSVPFTQVPTVTIEGYPLAWHAATGRFPSVRVQAAGMPTRIEPHDVVLADVDLTLTDVGFSLAEVRARTAKGTARLSYDDLSRIVGVPVGSVDGRLRATYTTELFGLEVAAVVTGVPGLDRAAQTVTLVDPEVSVAGFSLGKEASAGLIGTLVKPVPLTLQNGFMLDALSPAADGLLLSYGGAHVVFPLR